MKISLGIDTSGNTGNQLGTTGIARIDNNPLKPGLAFIKAQPEETEQQYFQKIINAINIIYKESTKKQIPLIITIEKYIDYGKGATKFTTPPTIKLNTEIESWVKEKANVFLRQKPASHLKHRWSDKVLIAEGYNDLEIFKKRKTKPNKDMIDALRASLDGWYFWYPEPKKEKK